MRDNELGGRGDEVKGSRRSLPRGSGQCLPPLSTSHLSGTDTQPLTRAACQTLSLFPVDPVSMGRTTYQGILARFLFDFIDTSRKEPESIIPRLPARPEQRALVRSLDHRLGPESILCELVALIQSSDSIGTRVRRNSSAY